MRDTVVLVLCWFISGGGVPVSGAAEQHMMQPRVPAASWRKPELLLARSQTRLRCLPRGKRSTRAREPASIVMVRAVQAMGRSPHR